MAISSQDGEPLRPAPYNPLDKAALAKSVEKELLSRESERLDQVPRFAGAGIYAIYYTGPHQLYSPISGGDTPIYVGKADPPGARKALTDVGKVGTPLWNRIAQHRTSVSQAEDLDPADFQVRYLVADELFIALAESLMIRTFRPVWNQVVDGFGNHDPGGRRMTGRVTDWDTLHPGRPWVAKMPSRDSGERTAIIARVQAALITHHSGGGAVPEAPGSSR